MPQILGQHVSSSLSTGGITQNNLTQLQTSQQHNTYSINGTPTLPNLPLPSQLDLNGQTPITYLSNPPG
jgi:hypothetical protein